MTCEINIFCFQLKVTRERYYVFYFAVKRSPAEGRGAKLPVVTSGKVVRSGRL